MEIRYFETEDAHEVSELIISTLKTTNALYEPEDVIKKAITDITPQKIIERASFTHFYLIVDDTTIVGTGAIGPYWDSKTESSLFTIFVDPQYQGRGIGNLIIETLENDEYFKRATRVEVPASITAVDFYRKHGYMYKNDIAKPDSEGLVRLEKHL
ncbi:GNAT family N-acetyltransferase [Staphylococcus kloosii]|jgi:ribosomal protein S18 acetylase RimI-like enzyme|uniref:GNAT family N-acetyltransferase n=1 Tax=Staphylococcus kloosii TaxID=29384 RepID=UPI00189D2085|nr:GNAT family N-acetyltransferase [Staphylococcus kloosii]MBF7025563.1 GNAT family N-acetyltransferase [Staphylococcus kloosii]